MDPLSKLIRNPVLLLSGSGAILDMNPRAASAWGSGVSRWDQVFADGGPVRELLSRASGSAEPVLGALNVVGPSGQARRTRVEALALRRADGVAYAVKIVESEHDQFAALTHRLQELNREIAVRRRTQAQLEEALSHNQVIYRELQHRVKNHLQMMLALVSAAGRESLDPAHRAFVRMLQAKLSALFDAQRLMYAEDTADGVRADYMLNAIANTVQSLMGPNPKIDVRAERLVVPNDLAFPMALIANELITNAVKHGGARAGALIWATLERSGPDAVLQVKDNGPGFAEPASQRSSSGLGLVRGLCRQIGGRLDVMSAEGAVATVTFPLPEAAHVVS